MTPRRVVSPRQTARDDVLVRYRVDRRHSVRNGCHAGRGGRILASSSHRFIARVGAPLSQLYPGRARVRRRGRRRR